MDFCNKYVNKSCVCINIETTAQKCFPDVRTRNYGGKTCKCILK